MKGVAYKNVETPHYAGIDVGGTTIKSGIISSSGTIVYHSTIETNAHLGRDAVIALLKQTINNLYQTSNEILSIGIGFPSVVHPDGGVVHYPPNLPGWGVVPLRAVLQEITEIPVVIHNDANVAALAEGRLGAGQGSPNFLYITLGTGVGGGIIINGNIYSGERGGAGEIGHIIVNADEFPTQMMIEEGREYRAGTLEERLGRHGIRAEARRIARKHPDSLLNQVDDALDVEHISEAAHKGDAAALECLRVSGRTLGLGLASALAILDMRLVVVGGGISQAHPLLLDSVRETLRKRALPTIAPEVEIRLAHFSAHAGVVGAALAGMAVLESR